MGMMFTGRFADEATLYRLAGQLEKELPWIGSQAADLELMHPGTDVLRLGA